MQASVAHSAYQGILFALFSYFINAVGDALKKYIGMHYSVFDALVWMSLFAVIFICITAAAQGRFVEALTTKRPLVHLLRVCLTVPVMFLCLYVLQTMQLVMFYTIVFTTPFMTAIMAHFVFKEHLTPMRIFIICLGFAGTLVAYRPTVENMDLAFFLCILIAFLCAILCLTFKLAIPGEHKLTYALYPNAACVVIGGFLASDQLFEVSWSDLAVMFGAGVCTVLGLVFSVKAFQNAPAAVVSSVHYTQIIWGAILGAVMFQNIPDLFTLVGASIILASGLLLAMSERVKKKPLEL